MPSPTRERAQSWASELFSALRAGLRFLDLQRLELAADGEVVVVEHQRARDAVLVKLERDRVDRNLLTARLVGALEIAHGHGPALHAGELLLVARRIVRHALVRPDLTADDGERIVDLLAAFRAVVDREFENALIVARRLDNAPHVLSRKDDGGIEVERLVLGLRQYDPDDVLSALGAPVDRIDQLLVEVVLRRELVGFGGTVLPGRRAQVAQRDLAFAIVELGDLAKIELVAVAQVAGEVIENAATRRDRAALAAGLGKLELIHRAVRRKLTGRRQRRRSIGPSKHGSRRYCYG